MAVKRVELQSIGSVGLYKRRGIKSIRLSVNSDGAVRVSLPMWAPYRLGIEFVRAKQSWIANNQPPLRPGLRDGDSIATVYRLVFKKRAGTINGRISGRQICVNYPPKLSYENKLVQATAERACLRAVRQHAEQTLPPQLQLLAKANNFSYKNLKIKRLKSRWGSCDSYGNITLNYFLVQLPPELIDYVLLHELVHTRVLKHGPQFWNAMLPLLPNVQQLRKAIRRHQPRLTVKSVIDINSGTAAADS
jgi:predicted metal-dependent hydrolase